MPGGWLTLQDIYRCTVDAELFGRKIGEARELADRLCPVRAVIATKDLAAHKGTPRGMGLGAGARLGQGGLPARPRTPDRLKELKVAYATEESGGGAGSEFREQVEAIERWYLHDWTALDAKLRTSIVEGISVFLSLFDQPQVAGVFCPPPPPAEEEPPDETAPDENDGAGHPVPCLRRRLPPLSELIEGGKVLALNMPAGANPALARAIGVLLKNAWMQALLRRPAELARRPGRYLRPAVFILRRVPGVRDRRPGRSRWRREGVRADAAVPLRPDRRHAVDLLAPLGAPRRRGLAHAPPDAPHPDLPVLERRVGRPGSRPRCAGAS